MCLTFGTSLDKREFEWDIREYIDVPFTAPHRTRFVSFGKDGSMQPETSSAIILAHREAISTPLNEMVSALQDRLSRRITAYIAGVDNVKAVTRWASGEVSAIRDPAVEQKLRTAYEIFLLLANYESGNTVKAWFIGLNPQLGDEAPIDALREGRLKESVNAARAFTVGG